MCSRLFTGVGAWVDSRCTAFFTISSLAFFSSSAATLALATVAWVSLRMSAAVVGRQMSRSSLSSRVLARTGMSVATLISSSRSSSPLAFT